MENILKGATIATMEPNKMKDKIGTTIKSKFILSSNVSISGTKMRSSFVSSARILRTHLIDLLWVLYQNIVNIGISEVNYG